MKDVIRDIAREPEAGRELSQSLARHPKVFSPFYLSMVRVGEATGMLDEFSLRLFEHLEFERFMREQVKTALRYPMFVVIGDGGRHRCREYFRHSGLCQRFSRASAPNCR